MDEYARYHDEVAEALKAIGNPALGDAIRRDRGSELEHLGIRFPALRKRVKQGFSFYGLSEDEVLRVWDVLWRSSPYGDVLFAALEYYLPIARKAPPPGLWPVVNHWSGRVDNWCHADMLSNLYSHLLQHCPDEVYPQLEVWNASGEEWLRRLSIVSLIHPGGKNAVFLPPERVLSLVESCISDHRYYLQLAVGWVLREMHSAYPAEVAAFLESHAPAMDARALSRALEHHPPEERKRVKALRAGQAGI